MFLECVLGSCFTNVYFTNCVKLRIAMFVRRENTFADTMHIYDIVNTICKISRCNFKYHRCAACIYMHVYINVCMCALCICLGSTDLLSPITDGSRCDQQNEHNRTIRRYKPSRIRSANSMASSFEMYI